jgi:hypothetical protein
MDQTGQAIMSKKWLLPGLQFFFLFVFGLVSISALHPDIRATLRSHLVGDDSRTVLSTAFGDLTGQGDTVKVVKVQSKAGLFLEVYRSGETGSLEQMAQIPLPSHRDGFFHFNGQSSNLALEDVTGDQMLEIISPSFDADMVAHLHVFRFNKITRQFERVQDL